MGNMFRSPNTVNIRSNFGLLLKQILAILKLMYYIIVSIIQTISDSLVHSIARQAGTVVHRKASVW